jgi:hypothetical protein
MLRGLCFRFANFEVYTSGILFLATMKLFSFLSLRVKTAMSCLIVTGFLPVVAYDMIYDMIYMIYDMIYDTIYDTIWYDMIRYDMIRCDTI